MTETALMAARERLTSLSREIQKDPRTVVQITHRGKPSMALMSAQLYDTLVDTLDVMADPSAVDALRASLDDIAEGRLRTLDEVAARLGLSR
jgi:antitoxin YefM